MCLFFFFNDTATTEIYTLSLHDALPIYPIETLFDLVIADHARSGAIYFLMSEPDVRVVRDDQIDRKSTRLNSSHGYISYAVFCLKKKKKQGALPSRCPRLLTSQGRPWDR